MSYTPSGKKALRESSMFDNRKSVLAGSFIDIPIVLLTRAIGNMLFLPIEIGRSKLTSCFDD